MFLNDVSAQLSEDAQPFSSVYNLSPIDQFEEMPYFSKAAMIQEDNDKITHGLKVHRFAKMLNVGLQPFNSGSWDETGGGKVWRLGIHSSEAYSLYLVFSEFKLTPGVKMFVYNLDYTSIAGAFTSRNNNKFNKLAVAPIAGDVLIVELDIPSGIDDFGKLVLSKVGHDYRNQFGPKKLKSVMFKSDTCEVDINCPIGLNWQDEKRAVCKMIVNGDLCTGTLVNNASNLKIPYLLTAYHCVSTQTVAEEGVYYFNYEHVSCNGTVSTSAQTLSGAELVSTTPGKLDFTLLKLNTYPPLYYQPYFVGWDAGTGAPLNGVVIHHPEGDVKKISIDNHELITGNFGEGFDSLSHWQVLRYDVGATEGGSSGSPIFNPQHRLVGTLTGGQASCADPENDYFTKFCLDWNKYPDSANQVKCWLNPENKNITFINGYDPYNVSLGVCDTFWNISRSEHLMLSQDGFKWGYLSGHNSSGYTQFAEKFYNRTVIKIPGVFMYVAKAYHSDPFSNITLKIWEGNYFPTNEIYSKPFYISQLNANAINFLGFDTVITTAGNFFIGYEVNYGAKQDTFAVYQATNRGVTGPSTMYINNGTTWESIDMATSPAIYSALSIGLVGCDGSPDIPVGKTIEVLPTAFSDQAQVNLPDGVTIEGVSAYDCVGRKVQLNFEINNTTLYIYAGFLSNGVYTLVLKTRSKPLYARFVIINK